MRFDGIDISTLYDAVHAFCIYHLRLRILNQLGAPEVVHVRAALLSHAIKYCRLAIDDHALSVNIGLDHTVDCDEVIDRVLVSSRAIPNILFAYALLDALLHTTVSLLAL